MIPIVQKGDPVLRAKARKVAADEFNSPYIKDVIKRMTEALYQEDDGVAIAAPQIGESIQLFIVAGKVLSPHYPDLEEGEIPPPDLICFNPEITKLSKTKKKMAEGCLSVRWFYGNVLRSTKAIIKAYDTDGKVFTRGGSGLLAQIFQHEIDHLNGILFIDTAEDLEDLPPEKQHTHE
jgi:peptide deformylase